MTPICVTTDLPKGQGNQRWRPAAGSRAISPLNDCASAPASLSLPDSNPNEHHVPRQPAASDYSLSNFLSLTFADDLRP
jgi:hypothetical protein